MRILNKEKTVEVFNPNLELGYLKDEKLFIKHHKAVTEVSQVIDIRVTRELDNGSKEYEEYLTVEGVDAKETYDEFEDINVYIPYTESELLNMKKSKLRQRRDAECFAIINRNFFFNEATIDEMTAINDWYKAWLNVTKTLVLPTVPKYITDRNS